jgi:predicted enzyme related to lactoylglutathione lyase
MTHGLRTLIIPVKDLDAAKGLYGSLLGVEPTADMPYYVGYDVGDQHIGLDPNGHGGVPGPVGYWHVDDIAETISRLVAAGATVDHDVSDVGGGKLRAVLRDGDGNVFGLIQDRKAGA